jgi:carbon storage regulator CsrA
MLVSRDYFINCLIASATELAPEDERMLVLSRKAGEAIGIAEDIVIVVHNVRGDRVTIGIEAPPRAGVLRGDLLGNAPGVASSTTSLCGDTDRTTP